MKVAFPGPGMKPGKLSKPSAKVENQEFSMVTPFLHPKRLSKGKGSCHLLVMVT